jgi:hypothetical protein
LIFVGEQRLKFTNLGDFVVWGYKCVHIESYRAREVLNGFWAKAMKMYVLPVRFIAVVVFLILKPFERKSILKDDPKTASELGLLAARMSVIALFGSKKK